jgi:DNA replicative helicase MCM subunit Mcm2 (Cdc46/Mcm family)
MLKELSTQVILIPEYDVPRGMRDLVAEDFAKIVHLKGIVVAASKPRIKATSMMLQCKVNSQNALSYPVPHPN